MANTNFPPQISKARSIDGFGEDIGQLSLGDYISHLNISFLYMVCQEVVSPLKLSHSLMEDWIFGYRNGSGVIANEGNSLKAHSKVSHGVHNPYDLDAVASSLCGGLSNSRLFLRRSANERRSNKLTSNKGALLVNPITRKISIGKTHKIQ
jgi:hypothetical protein